MKPNQPSWKIGDAVVVKEGIQDVDADSSIGGYQGRVIDVGEEEQGKVYLGLQWDSLTLKSMPLALIEDMEEKGLDWATYYLGAEEVELATERDTPAQVNEAVQEIAHQVGWVHLGAAGRRIQKILAGIDPEDTMAVLAAWERYLRPQLSFPFDAKVSEDQERGDLHAGDQVRVQRLRMVNDLYGIIVEVSRGRERYEFPLGDLEVLEKNSPPYQPVRDYGVWFANH